MPGQSKEYCKAWAKANPEKIKTYQRTYRAKHYDEVIERSRKSCRTWRKEKLLLDPLHRIRRALRERYGITPEQRDEMREAQGGLCAICQRTSKDGKLVIDHCHTSGKIRGLLCHNCNLTLGKFQDNPDWFRQAAAYVEKT